MDYMLEKNLSDAAISWIKNPGFKCSISESMLIIPIAKYFEAQDYEVVAEADCHYLLKRTKEQKSRSHVNYDVYVEKENGPNYESIILEVKWLKNDTKFRTKNF